MARRRKPRPYEEILRNARQPVEKPLAELKPHQIARLEPSVGVEHRLPCEDSHNEACPERQHDRTRDDRAPPLVHARYRVGAGQGEDDAPERDLERYLERVPYDSRVVWIHELPPCIHAPFADTAVRGMAVEGERENDKRRHREKQRQPQEARQRYEPLGLARTKRVGGHCTSTM